MYLWEKLLFPQIFSFQKKVFVCMRSVACSQNKNFIYPSLFTQKIGITKLKTTLEKGEEIIHFSDGGL